MIGEKSRVQAERLLAGLIGTHWQGIREAYSKTEKGLKVRLCVGFEEIGGKVHVLAEINFIVDRVKNQVDALVDEKQEELFKSMEKFKAGIEKTFEEGDSFTISAGGESATIQGKKKIRGQA